MKNVTLAFWPGSMSNASMTWSTASRLLRGWGGLNNLFDALSCVPTKIKLRKNKRKGKERRKET